MAKISFQPIYRCYNNSLKSSRFSTVVGNSLFDLIGTKEPDQTKSLGYVLARSANAMKKFLSLLNSHTNPIQVTSLMNDDYFVDCEFMLPQQQGSSVRADVVIQFPKSNVIVIVEAKSLKAKTPVSVAISQGYNYAKLMESGGLITPSYKKIVVGLTNHQEYSPQGIALKWSDIIEMFDKIVNSKGYSSQLEKDYLNYLLKINSYMNYYDIEVLSIPAGISIDAVQKTGLYECPTVGKHYASIGKHKPLYIAFRGKGGYVNTLYKVADLMRFPICGPEFDSKIKPNLPQKIVQAINDYKKIRSFNSSDTSEKWVFVLDSNNSIKLPNNVIYTKNNTFIDTKHTLADYFAAPALGQGCVFF